ncbi:hypothetical protein D7Z26_02840 [Cohnella endophytica]|uniref:DUF2092 domain-containing protein n=1 Tax=Cohnella endophytica TaxID=2419778 RepID=A0A494YAJ9_9BACL|nr:hypothetical protein [Cohnella endophytica]RKP56942.1 hypothetical protein D7Z26_02840 [Cohnella endophytica]
MIKKKWLMTGGAIGISSVVMLSTGLTALAGTSGYEDYKTALKTTKALNSVSVQAVATLRDNGIVLTEAQGNLKANLKTETKSGSFKVSNKGVEQSVELYSLTDGQAWKKGDADTYFVKKDPLDKESDNSEESKDSSWLDQQAETVIDALVGNLKDYVTVDTRSDGSKSISLSLDSVQIPAVVQALAPLAFKKLSDTNGHEGKDQKEKQNPEKIADPEDMFGKSLFDPANLVLTQEIHIRSISLNADVNAAGDIERQQASVVFTGKDASGAAHELNLNLDLHLSGFDQTTPDTIDLTGKKVQTIQDRHEGRHRD